MSAPHRSCVTHGLSPCATAIGHLLEYIGKGTDHVPDSLWAAVSGSEISKVTISKNTLTSFPSNLLNFAPTLTILDLSFNRIRQLGPEMGTLTGLATLNVRNNQLSSLPAELASLKGLTDVIFSLNRFSEFPRVLYIMRSLTTVVATDNQIGSVDSAGLTSLTNLSCLDLTNNSINKVPPELGLLENLKSLKLEGNCFKIPRFVDSARVLLYLCVAHWLVCYRYHCTAANRNPLFSNQPAFRNAVWRLRADRFMLCRACCAVLFCGVLCRDVPCCDVKFHQPTDQPFLQKERRHS